MCSITKNNKIIITIIIVNKFYLLCT